MRLKINRGQLIVGRKVTSVIKLQQVFTETRLEDVDLSKPQTCKYFVYME